MASLIDNSNNQNKAPLGNDSPSDERLESIAIFKDIPINDIKNFIKGCPIQHFAANTVLMSPEIINDHVLILLKGSVTIHLDSMDNKAITELAAGETVGEISTIDGSKPISFVLAAEEITAIVINSKRLQRIIDTSHTFAKNVLSLLSTRLRQCSTAAQESRKLQKEYEKSANIDVLTGLYNRRWINNFFKRTLQSSTTDGFFPELSVMLIDADHFKTFNDQHGHFAGDYALKCIAEALTENIRPTDFAARYGGEEFMIILPGTSWDQAEIVAERVRQGVYNKKITVNEQEYPNVSISSGITQVKPCDEFGDVINAVDQALYQAKNSGRNCIRIRQR